MLAAASEESRPGGDMLLGEHLCCPWMRRFTIELARPQAAQTLPLFLPGWLPDSKVLLANLRQFIDCRLHASCGADPCTSA